MRGRAGVFLVLVSVATAVYFVAPDGYLVEIYNVIAVATAVTMLSIALRSRPSPTGAWLLIALGIAASAGGDIVFGAGQLVPSPADMLYISAYPLLALGLSGLCPWRASARTGANIALAVGIAGSVGMVLFAFLVLPATDDGSGLASKVVSIGYPVMDVALIGLLLRARGSDNETPLKLLGAALGLLLIGDVAYATTNFGNAYEIGGIVDAAWLISYGFFGAAMLAIRPVADGIVFFSSAPQVLNLPVPQPGGGGVAVMERVAPQKGALAVQVADLRFTLVLGWTGRILLGFGVVAMFFGAAWQSPEAVVLAGAYVFCGIVTSFVGGLVAKL